jgi:hypothetical protein
MRYFCKIFWQGKGRGFQFLNPSLDLPLSWVGVSCIENHNYFIMSPYREIRGILFFTYPSVCLSAKNQTLVIPFERQEKGISFVCTLWQDISWMLWFLTSRLWPWSWTYFFKTLTLATPFEWLVIGISYVCICTYLAVRPFFGYFNFGTSTLEVWGTF